MTPEHQEQAAALGSAEALGRILSTELGEPSPPEGYRHPLSEEASERFEERLEDVDRAQADAAARLPTLYAD